MNQENELIRNNVHIFIIRESKLDPSFSNSQFHIPGYRLFRKNRNKNEGGLMCHVNPDLPVKIVTSNTFRTNLNVSTIEITLGKRRILFLVLCCIWKMR